MTGPTSWPLLAQHRISKLWLVGAAALPCLLLTTACTRSPAAKAAEAQAKLRSWAATVELTERERARGAVPAGYAAQVRRAADEERPKAEAELRTAVER